jgi:hypothetical protein
MEQKITNQFLDKFSIKFSNISSNYILRNLNKNGLIIKSSNIKVHYKNGYEIIGLNYNNIPKGFPSFGISYSHRKLKLDKIRYSATYFRKYKTIEIMLKFNKKIKINKKLLESCICRSVRHELQHYKQFKENNNLFHNMIKINENSIKSLKEYYLQPFEIDAYLSSYVLISKLYKKPVIKQINKNIKFSLKKFKKYSQYKQIVKEIINKYKEK